MGAPPDHLSPAGQNWDLAALAPGARVGTSSLRRQCQLLAARPDLEVATVRGGVHTRLAKLDAGEFDALILAAAGLDVSGSGKPAAGPAASENG